MNNNLVERNPSLDSEVDFRMWVWSCWPGKIAFWEAQSSRMDE